MPSKPIELQSEIAKALEPVWDGRIYIGAVNGPMLFKEKATPQNTKPASIA
jgi:hypothetical protein